MSTPTLIVVILVVPVTLAVFALTGLVLSRRVRAALDEATASYRRIEPYLDQLERDAAVSRRELDNLEASVARLAETRAERRRAGANSPRPHRPAQR